MRQSKCFLPIISLVLVCVILVGYAVLRPTPSPLPSPIVTAQPAFELEIDPVTGHMTLRARDASLGEILFSLKDKYQIEVIVPYLTEQTVTARFQDIPLPDALAMILPKDSRFHFRTGDLEIPIPGITEAEKEGRGREPKQPALPTKGKTIPLPEDQKIHIKLPPEKFEPTQTTGEAGTKLPPSEGEIPSGEGPKKAEKPVPEEARYARLRLYIDQSGIRVEHFFEIEGSLIESTTVDGDFFYVALVGSQPVAVGSMQDPLVVRSYRKDFSHSETRAEKATFLISLPATFLDNKTLAETNILFFYLEPVGEIPQMLTPKTFPEFKEHLRQVGVVSSKELLAAHAERIRQ